MRLLLIRHAQTPSNVRGLLDTGAPGPGLTELGYRQAGAIPGALQDREISSITVSNLVRTSLTAAPLAEERGLTPVIDPGVREIDAGDDEMASGFASFTRYIEVAWAWASGDLDVRMPGAENGHEFFDRFDGAVERALASGGPHPVIVSHGAAIRVWVGGRCHNMGDLFSSDIELHNTGSALVERDEDGGWTLLEWTSNPIGGPQLDSLSDPATQDPTGSLTAEDLD